MARYPMRKHLLKMGYLENRTFNIFNRIISGEIYPGVSEGYAFFYDNGNVSLGLKKAFPNNLDNSRAMIIKEFVESTALPENASIRIERHHVFGEYFEINYSGPFKISSSDIVEEIEKAYSTLEACFGSKSDLKPLVIKLYRNLISNNSDKCFFCKKELSSAAAMCSNCFALLSQKYSLEGLTHPE